MESAREHAEVYVVLAPNPSNYAHRVIYRIAEWSRHLAIFAGRGSICVWRGYLSVSGTENQTPSAENGVHPAPGADRSVVGVDWASFLGTAVQGLRKTPAVVPTNGDIVRYGVGVGW